MFIIYLLIINLITLIVFSLDKLKAKNNKWRISENILLLFSILGGSSGALVAMVLFKHKTNKLKFTIPIPLTFIIHRILEIYIFNYLK
ncbi:MAG: DUF1294 domain-containing protein [Tissierellia bacterium]|nr:DUF1294 domain-containing protein [Tissierellia bacterium]